MTKQNTVFFDVNTKFKNRNSLTQIGAVHAASGKSFNRHLKPGASTAAGIKDFKTFLKKVNKGKPVTLVGHNAHKFDKKVLETAAKKNRVRIQPKIVQGYCDTLPAMKKNLNLKKNSMDNLAKTFSEPRKTHDALQVRYLRIFIGFS